MEEGRLTEYAHKRKEDMLLLRARKYVQILEASIYEMFRAVVICDLRYSFRSVDGLVKERVEKEWKEGASLLGVGPV